MACALQGVLILFRVLYCVAAGKINDLLGKCDYENIQCES